MTGRQWLTEARRRLPEEASHEALLMLADARGVTPGRARLLMDEALTGAAGDQLEMWLAARERGEPLQYVQNCAYFMGHTFQVDGRVLIPRADTEILCEQAIERARHGQPDVLDLCTGSGAIAIAIALACPAARVTACDISAAALAVARGNAAALGAAVEFVEGDFLSAVAGRTFDVIACNPPYLTGPDMACLSPEVAREPALALDGGADGLAFYRRAAKHVRGHLTPQGWALFEVGAGQADAVAALLGGETAIYQDYAGIPRVVAMRHG